jgi:hypothetical protein
MRSTGSASSTPLSVSVWQIIPTRAYSRNHGGTDIPAQAYGLAGWSSLRALTRKVPRPSRVVRISLGGAGGFNAAGSGGFQDLWVAVTA